MAHTLKDRILLRQLRKSLNSTLFGQQNHALSKPCHIDPEWIHQSRMNFQYIYSQLNAFWPDWAIEQFNPSDESSVPPPNELYCLNTSTREIFSFYPSNKFHQMTINRRGYIAFPFLHWGISIQCLDQNQWGPFFESDISLSPNAPLIEYAHQKPPAVKASFRLSLHPETAEPQFEITLKNTSEDPLQQSLHVGILPYTNEGVGGIRSIQYCSNQQLIINDSSIVSASQHPTNVVCTTYAQGNVFKRSKEWDMILSSTCDDFLASGILCFDLNLAPKKKVSLAFNVRHASPFITPLFFPLQKINRYFLSTSPTPPEGPLPPPMVDVALTKLPTQLQSLPLVIQYYLSTLHENSATWSNQGLYFTLQSLMQLNASQHIHRLLATYMKSPISSSSRSILSQHQQRLFHHAHILDTLFQFRFNAPDILQPLTKQLQQLVSSDSFFVFIKKLNIKKFNAYINSRHVFQLFLKLLLFSFVSNIMNQHKLETVHTKDCKEICANYLKIICSKPSLMSQFIDTFASTGSIQLTDKLFFCHTVFRQLLPSNMQQSIIAKIIDQYWRDNQLVDSSHFQGYSTQTNLMFCYVATPDYFQPIISQYLSKINAFGDYINPKSLSSLFTSFPAPLVNHHAMIIHFLFNLMVSTKGKVLHIPALLYFPHLDMSKVNTPFGTLSLKYSQKSRPVCIEFHHEFKTSPKSIVLYCPKDCTSFSFSTNKSANAIENHRVIIPLNESNIYLS